MAAKDLQWCYYKTQHDITETRIKIPADQDIFSTSKAVLDFIAALILTQKINDMRKSIPVQLHSE